MFARPGRPKRSGLSFGQSLGVALVVFVILCALVVVIAASDEASQEPAAASSPLLEVMQELEVAREELDTNNFGKARAHLQQARARLYDLLPPAAKQPPAAAGD